MAIAAQTSTITAQPSEDAAQPSAGAASQVRTAFPAKRADRAVLDGGWWPRSYDPAAELPGLVELLSDRFGPIRQLLLSSAVWEGRFRRLTVGSRAVRVGWFASVDPGLLVATTERGDQIDLLVVPPQTAVADAERAMATAADPTNRKRPAAIL
jgi:hypothetical protein